MVDVCLRATSESTRLEVTVAIATRAVTRAQAAHGLAPTATVALGRLLVATGMVALTDKREGTTTAQVLSQSRAKHLLVDANTEGHLRGFARAPEMDFPPTREARESGRVELAPYVRPGQLSVIRRGANQTYQQSSIELLSGEIDRDMELYLDRSDQVPTVLAAEVLMDGDEVQMAAGVLVQAMPDGDRARLEEIRRELVDGGLARRLKTDTNPESLLVHVQPDAQVVYAPVILQWKCRCSEARVLRSFQMLEQDELREMIDKGETTEVTCDFCARAYQISPEQLQGVLQLLSQAQG